jgi:hypothetical protein
MDFKTDQITYILKYNNESTELQQMLFPLGYHWRGSAKNEVIFSTDRNLIYALHIHLKEKIITYWDNMKFIKEYEVNLVDKETFLSIVNPTNLL